LKTIQERLGHTLSGSPTLDIYTHAEMPRNIEAGSASTKGDRKSSEFCQLNCCARTGAC